MSEKLRCIVCSKGLKAYSNRLPVPVLGYAEVRKDPDNNYIPGSTIRRELITKKIIIGYGCKSCLKKEVYRDFIKKHNIKQKSGEKMRHAVNVQIEENKKMVIRESNSPTFSKRKK